MFLSLQFLWWRFDSLVSCNFIFRFANKRNATKIKNKINIEKWKLCLALEFLQWETEKKERHSNQKRLNGKICLLVLWLVWKLIFMCNLTHSNWTAFFVSSTFLCKICKNKIGRNCAHILISCYVVSLQSNGDKQLGETSDETHLFPHKSVIAPKLT